ncbi:TlpA family protein disulfide reductase [Mucilaginibacter glaciei]|uniref:TlpA family protein disulfide reductase n=1 Tax=Mucilaginibacter glaciei TaxID=2772109 RepID=A0A926S013_9SPHI|nr:TlpA disulfide reductase family protein [Mucilaginibacter glaciei]MBD1392440.1 TlpA family protein disulfide reductase [Mucilaginibacter glaciei]
MTYCSTISLSYINQLHHHEKALFTYLAIFQRVHFCKPGKPVEAPEVILKNYDSFFTYLQAHYKPNQDLVAFDVNAKPISKAVFFQKLITSKYLPVRLTSDDGKLYYKLYPMTAKQSKDMGGYISGFAYAWAGNYSKEGKRFPAFNFVDLNGNKYNNANTKGKVLVVKCWFIGCQRCEEEMPELNALKARYKNRTDIVFVSLAPDSKAKLQAFLKRKRFDYPVIANQDDFMVKKLGITAYPTHLIVNKQGMVVNVVNDPAEIDWALQHKI